MKTYDVALFFMLCIFSICNFTHSATELRQYYIRSLCENTNTATLDISHVVSVILKAGSYNIDPLDCKIKISPKPGSSVVLSISSYQVDTDEHVSITDSDDVMIVLRGERYFYDEEKSFTSNGPMTIHIVSNDTFSLLSLKFQFIFTQVHDKPCHFTEFQCRNLKCIPSGLTCDSHNHCGDNSDEADDLCYAPSSTERPSTRNPVIITKTHKISIVPIVIAAAAILLILIIVIPLTVYGVKKMKRNSKPQAAIPGTIPQPPTAPAPQMPSSSTPQLPTVLVLQQNPTAPAHMHAGPWFARLRQSFRSSKSPAVPPPNSAGTNKERENYQVPSMYPQIPPDVSCQEGVDNLEFKIEE